MLEIDNLDYTYKYQSMEYKYSFSLDVRAGEIVGVLGESGSGKSTMLDLVAGFLESEGGSILLDDMELSGLVVEQRPITILFQNNNLFEHLSVYDNVLIGVNKSLKSNEKERANVISILKEVGLKGYEKKSVSALSGGQQQRVALARCLLRKSSILLLDEPFTGLDLHTRMQMLKLLREITTKRKLHTIMVTHELEDCNLIADEVYSVLDGKLVKGKSWVE